jgi:hypothetical protein
MMKDVMLRTRALGKSIETYFQKFGSRIDGPTELTYGQFKLAIKSLGLSWADDNSILKMIFTSLDQNAEHKDRGGLGLDEIALGVLDCVTRSVVGFESDYLEQTYQHLIRSGTFRNLKETMMFLNFKRDYSCTQAQFQ